MTDNYILIKYLKENDKFYNSFDFENKENKLDYEKGMFESFQFQSYLAKLRLKEALDNVKNDIKKLPLVKRFLVTKAFNKLCRINIFK